MNEEERRAVSEALEKIGTASEEAERLARKVHQVCQERQCLYDAAETREAKRKIVKDLFDDVAKDTVQTIVRLAVREAVKVVSQQEAAPNN